MPTAGPKSFNVRSAKFDVENTFSKRSSVQPTSFCAVVACHYKMMVNTPTCAQYKKCYPRGRVS